MNTIANHIRALAGAKRLSGKEDSAVFLDLAARTIELCDDRDALRDDLSDLARRCRPAVNDMESSMRGKGYDGAADAMKELLYDIDKIIGENWP